MRAPSLRLAAFLSLILLAVATTGRAAPADDGFWKLWGDGKAELSAFALTEPRYGAPRAGTAVLVFVTEDFSDSLRVKADPGKHPAGDVYPVVKLNAVRDFQTGIYDYNLMSSVFARADRLAGDASGAVVKTSFSAQEWCGHVYQQWLRHGDKLDGVAHSYFDGEADQAPVLDYPAGGLLEEALPIVLRGLRGDLLAPGERRTVPFLPSTMRARLSHRPQAWGHATLTRSTETRPVSTALGKLDAFTITVDEPGGPTTTWTLEAAAPHRILAWSSPDGESATLLGSARLPYWQLHDPGNESYLKQLGLPPPTAPRATAKKK